MSGDGNLGQAVNVQRKRAGNLFGIAKAGKVPAAYGIEASRGPRPAPEPRPKAE